MAQMLGDVTKAVVARAIAISRAGTQAGAGIAIGDDEAGTSSVSQEVAESAKPPAQVVRRKGGTRRGGLTVFIGGRLALHVAPTCKAAPARVGRLRLVTVDGERVHHCTA